MCCQCKLFLRRCPLSVYIVVEMSTVRLYRYRDVHCPCVLSHIVVEMSVVHVQVLILFQRCLLSMYSFLYCCRDVCCPFILFHIVLEMSAVHVYCLILFYMFYRCLLFRYIALYCLRDVCCPCMYIVSYCFRDVCCPS